MGLFGNKREKSEKVDKYEYHASSKGGRPGGYGPPALLGGGYFGGNPSYFDGFSQVAPSSQTGKSSKYANGNKSLYGGVDPMQQAMLLPPSSPAALQAQAAAMFSMQQYMQQQGQGAQFGGILPPIQMPLNVAQQTGILPAQSQPFYGAYPGQQPSTATPFVDPNNVQFGQMVGQPAQQPGAFAPYQQPNFYDPASASAYPAPYGYMPSAF